MAKKIERNDPCWCGSGKKYKKCHEAFDEKMELMKKKGYAVLDYLAEHIGPGVTTQQIDD